MVALPDDSERDCHVAAAESGRAATGEKVRLGVDQPGRQWESQWGMAPLLSLYRLLLS